VEKHNSDKLCKKKKSNSKALLQNQGSCLAGYRLIKEPSFKAAN